MGDFERVPARDACFLAFERTDLHMHVGGVAIFEAGSLRLTSGMLDLDRIRRYMTGCMESVPRCRQRIARVPFFGTVVWVDDAQFDIGRHVHLVRAPGAGTQADLQTIAGDIFSRPLDRQRPLWEFWFVDGLADRGRFAVVVKLHHCMADGRASIEFMRRFLSTSPDVTFADTEPPPYRPRPLPTDAALLRHEALRWLRAPAQLARALGHLVRDPGARADLGAKLRGAAATIWTVLRVTARSSLNRRVGPNRRFAWTAIDMKEVRTLRARYGGSVDDAALGVLTGALERLFAAHSNDDHPTRLRAMAPTSALTRQELQSFGNRVRAPLVTLPLWERSLDERMRRIQKEKEALARHHQGLGWDVLMDVAAWAGTFSQQALMWLATRIRAYNVILTLVPGPHFPLYLMGSKMVELHPMLPLLDHQTVAVGVLRYMGRLHWGVVSAPEYAESFPPLASQIDASLSELLGSAHATMLPSQRSSSAAGAEEDAI